VKGRALLHATIAAVAVAAVALGGATRPAKKKPTRIHLALTNGKTVQGLLVDIDDQRIVLTVGKDTRTIPLSEVKPVSIYVARRRVADLSKAQTHVDLGRFCLRNGLKQLADREFAQAVRMDKSLAQAVADARKTPGPTTARTRPATGPATTAAAATRPTTQAADGEGAGLTTVTIEQPKEVLKYTPATPAQIAANRKTADAWAEQSKAFAKTLHLVEPPHFLIYSAWDRSNDKPLADICTRMYAAMCKQFDIPPTQNIWAGKAAVYVFWEKDHFVRFCTDVYKRGNPACAGFCGWTGDGFVFIVMGPTRNKTWFYEVLVHEATHGFLSRYLTNRQPPIWVHEGLADYMAASLVPNAWAQRKYIDATKEAVRKNKHVAHVFTTVGLNAFDYGIAQSFVRYLIAKDRKAFIKFIRLMKEGKTDEQAMKGAYGFGKDEFLKRWAAASVKAVGTRR